jgi:hypothetical protein
MQFTAIPLSSIAIEITWMADASDTQQDSVTIYETGPNNQSQNQPGLSWMGGSTFFGKLSPSTTYQFKIVGFSQTDGGEVTNTLATTSAATLKAGSPAQQPPQQPQQPAPDETYPGAVQNVQAVAQPFGQIAVSWNQTGDWAELVTVQRYQVDVGSSAVVYKLQNYGQPAGNTGVDPARDGFKDPGPFVFNGKYDYWMISNNGQQTAVTAAPNSVLYPEFFGLREYLPLGFNQAQGVKSLRPNDHPYVSVRSIMSSVGSEG